MSGLRPTYTTFAAAQALSLRATLSRSHGSYRSHRTHGTHRTGRSRRRGRAVSSPRVTIPSRRPVYGNPSGTTIMIRCSHSRGGSGGSRWAAVVWIAFTAGGLAAAEPALPAVGPEPRPRRQVYVRGRHALDARRRRQGLALRAARRRGFQPRRANGSAGRPRSRGDGAEGRLPDAVRRDAAAVAVAGAGVAGRPPRQPGLRPRLHPTRGPRPAGQ